MLTVQFNDEWQIGSREEVQTHSGLRWLSGWPLEECGNLPKWCADEVATHKLEF